MSPLPLCSPARFMLALIHAVPITFLMLALFYKWFAVDDRFAVFLYNHLNATPFDEITTSRYAMAGLVADGVVLILYIAANWFLGRIVKHYRVPAWRQVWAWCAAPLVIGIVIITTTQNSPTLPFNLAIACALVTLGGLVFVLPTGSLAAHQPRYLAWLALDGLGLVPPLLFLRAVEFNGTRLAVANWAWLIALGSVVVGAVWLGVTSVLRVWRRTPIPTPREILGAGLCWSYFSLPLAHYLFATPPDFKYITAASNFITTNMLVQWLAWVVAIMLAAIATRLRNDSTNKPSNQRKE